MTYGKLMNIRVISQNLLYPLALFTLMISPVVFAQHGPPPAPVVVAEAELRSMLATAVMPGTVVSREDASISTEISGRLLSIADIGVQLKKGDVLAEIDNSRLKLQLAELKAQVNRAEARKVFLRAEEKRMTQLASKKLASATLLEQTRADRQAADSDLEVAKVRLQQTEDDLDRSHIRAPFPGTVVARLSNVGERLAVGDKVLRLVNSASLEIVTRAPLQYMPYSHPGDELVVTSGKINLSAPIRTLVAVGNERTHVFEMRLDLPPNTLPVGQTVRVRVPVAEQVEVLAVPRDALILRGTGTSVLIIANGNSSRKIAVETGISEADWIEVIGDIQAGDQVIIRGAERLRPGQKVSIQNSSNTEDYTPQPSRPYTDDIQLENGANNATNETGDRGSH